MTILAPDAALKIQLKVLNNKYVFFFSLVFFYAFLLFLPFLLHFLFPLEVIPNQLILFWTLSLSLFLDSPPSIPPSLFLSLGARAPVRVSSSSSWPPHCSAPMADSPLNNSWPSFSKLWMKRWSFKRGNLVLHSGCMSRSTEWRRGVCHPAEAGWGLDTTLRCCKCLIHTAIHSVLFTKLLFVVLTWLGFVVNDGCSVWV